jgi:hypothetical protein
MAEIPKPSDIKNVFALNEPQHMVSKRRLKALIFCHGALSRSDVLG